MPLLRRTYPGRSGQVPLLRGVSKKEKQMVELPFWLPDRDSGIYSFGEYFLLSRLSYAKIHFV